MLLAVLSSFILAYCLVIMLFWRKALQAERMSSRITNIAKIGAVNNGDANELNMPFTERFLKPVMQGIMKWLSGMLPKSGNEKLAISLRMAGIRMKPTEFNAVRLIVGLSTGFTGVVFMRYWLASKIRTRKLAIQRQLPEVLDLLSVSVEAGLGFDAALQRISDRARGPLINELNATYREITLGKPRAEALRNFDQRCGLEEIKSFVAAIIQAEQLGISLKNVLKAQAQQMRTLKRQKVEEKAMKAPIKIMIPLVLFVFPVLFIILLGPAILSVIGMQGALG